MGLPVDRLPDDVLLEGFGAGDDELAVAFVRRFQSKVFGVALAVCADPAMAEDVSQQAFERAWRHAALYDARRGAVGTWLGTITRNLGIDAVRRRRPVPVDPADLLNLLVATAEGPEQAAVRSEATAQLRAALAGLPPPQARALVMAAIRGMTAAEVAVAEDIPLGTAKTRIRAAMGRLREAMLPAGVAGPFTPSTASDRNSRNPGQPDSTRRKAGDNHG